MCSLFDIFKHLLLRKTDVLQTCQKSKSLRKKIWKNAPVWRAKRYKVYSGKHLFWHYYLQLSFVYKTMSQISFKLFCSGFLGNEVDFRDIKNISPNILAKNKNFKKLRHSFVGERALIITMTLICPCHWKTLALFC